MLKRNWPGLMLVGIFVVSSVFMVVVLWSDSSHRQRRMQEGPRLIATTPEGAKVYLIHDPRTGTERMIAVGTDGSARSISTW